MENLQLPTEYQTIIHQAHYARWNEEEQRRETWPETVDRYMNAITKHLKDNLNVTLNGVGKELKQGILNLEVLPSMRGLWVAGPALERDNSSIFNCSYLAVNRPHAFDEACYLLMCGTGVGFSVERQYISNLPIVSEEFYPADDTVIQVKDSRIGWASALRQLIALLYAGQIPHWDLSKLRSAGARLKTFGGRSSGPKVLDDLFKFTVNLFIDAKGTKLTSIQCHDLMCMIASVIMAGGIRRGAMISLSNLSDERMRRAKSGQWWEMHPYRSLANNSIVYTETPDMGIFMSEWQALHESKSGERGIFNRQAAQKKVKSIGRRDPDWDWGVNPCSEIIMRNSQFCNLSQILIRPEETSESLKGKIRLATILGTIQSTFTNFRYLSKAWTTNSEEERLLGVGLNGILDNVLMSTPNNGLASILKQLKEVAIETNKEWAKKLGIAQSAAITTIKPSGNSSQLVNSASGIHPRYSEYYTRTIRMAKIDPLSEFLKDSGIPYEEDVIMPQNLVFGFPIKSSKKAILRNNLSALDHLNLWKFYQDHYCEHKASVTCFIRKNEWLHVAAWVYDNFADVSGISFLPYDDHIYRQAPYQEIDEQDYKTAMAKMPEKIDWSLLKKYEKDDNTTGAKEYACTGNACEI